MSNTPVIIYKYVLIGQALDTITGVLYNYVKPTIYNTFDEAIAQCEDSDILRRLIMTDDAYQYGHNQWYLITLL